MAGENGFVIRFPGVPAVTAVRGIIGGRPTQEDRCIISNQLTPRDGSLNMAHEAPREDSNHLLIGVFDGTVGDFASDTVKDLVVPALKASKPYKELVANDKVLVSAEKMDLLREGIEKMYQTADEELLRRCALSQNHYAASTSVTLVLYQDFAGVAHLGDSRICLLYMTEDGIALAQAECQPVVEVASEDADKETSSPGACSTTSTVTSSPTPPENSRNEQKMSLLSYPDQKLETFCPPDLDGGFSPEGALRTDSIPAEKVDDLVQGKFLTEDHKPDQVSEKARIELCGGSVEHLRSHRNKAYIRGGDFLLRKNLGEKPMQLQYSRAFGGKDLKPFGLTATPTVLVKKRTRDVLGFILGSDGLWDVLSADIAARTAMRAYVNNKNPATALCSAAKTAGSADNITAVCCIYDSFAGQREE